MSRDTALADADRLRQALLDHGVRQVSIELQAGRGPSADPWHARTFRACLSHHIASRPSQGKTPGLALIKRGRVGLPGPLCNGYGGYDLTARIITMGWANHPGTGGPWTIPGAVVPRNNGRPYLFGWEFEGGYEPYTDEMRDFMARCGAGTLAWLGQTPDAHGEHKTWAPGRKPDRLGYTTESGRAEIRRVIDERQAGEMPLTDDDLARIAQKVWTRDIKTEAGAVRSAEAILAGLNRGEFVGALIDGLFNTPIDRSDLGAGATSLAQVLRWSDRNTDRLARSIEAAVVAASAAPGDVAKAVREAVAQAVQDTYEATLRPKTKD